MSSEIQNFLSKEAKAEVLFYNKEIDKLITKYGKLGTVSIDLQKQKQAEIKTEESLIKAKTTLEKLNQQIAKTDTENIKAQQQLNKILIEEEKIAQQKIKTEKDQLTLTDKKNKAAVKERNEVIKQNSAYAQLNEKHKIATKRAQDLLAAYGRFNKKAIQARKEAKKYDTQLKKIDKSLGQNQRNVGNYGKRLISFVGQLGLVTGAAALIKRGIKGIGDVIQSTQSSGDGFNITLAGMKSSYDAFNKSLASGDLKNVFKNMEQAFKAGKAYATVMDDLSDRERDLAVTRSEANVEVQKLTNSVQNVTLADEERIKSAKKIFTIEANILDQSQSVRQQDYDAQVQLVSKLTGMKDDEILSFIKNYDEEKKLREKAIALSKLEADLKLARRKGWVDEYVVMKDSLTKQKAALTDTEKAYVETYKGYSKTTDEELDKVVASYVALQEAESSSISGLRRITNQYNTLVSKLKNDSVESTASQIDDLNKLDAKRAESVGIGIDGAVELTVTTEDVLKRQKEAQETYDSWYLMSQKEKWEKAQQYVSMFSGYAVSAINGVFALRIKSMENDLDETDAYYQTKLNIESNAGRDTAELESEYDLKREEIEKEKTKREKRAAIVSIGLTYAQAAFEIVANAAVLSSNPGTFALSPIAWAQLGALTLANGVQLAAVSQYDKGTTDSDSNFIAGEIAPEFGRIKGKWQLIDKPTMFTDAAHSEIISSAETDQILKGASMQANTGNTAMDVQRIVDAIHSMPQAPSMDKRGIEYIQKKNGSYTKYLNENVRRAR